MSEPRGWCKHRTSKPLAPCKENPYTLRTIELWGGCLISSKITSKPKTTVQHSVRAPLKLGAGDTLVYAIEGDLVVMTKASAATVDSPTAAFDEWSSEHDRHAYAGL